VTRRLVIAAILAISIGAPVVEMFDRWDHTLQDGNDTEADAVIAALCVGVACASGTIVVVGRIRALSSSAPVRAVASPMVSIAVKPFAIPVPTTSPPAPLRL
jgi:hypothetical protein